MHKISLIFEKEVRFEGIKTMAPDMALTRKPFLCMTAN